MIRFTLLLGRSRPTDEFRLRRVRGLEANLPGAQNGEPIAGVLHVGDDARRPQRGRTRRLGHVQKILYELATRGARLANDSSSSTTLARVPSATARRTGPPALRSTDELGMVGARGAGPSVPITRILVPNWIAEAFAGAV